MSQVKAIREKRYKLAMEMRQLVEDAAKRDNPGMNDEDNAKWARMDEEEKRLSDLADKLEKMEAADDVRATHIDAELRQEFRPNPKNADIVTRADRDMATRAWFMSGSGVNVPDEYREAARKVGVELGQGNREMRCLLPKAPKSMRELRDMMETRAGTTTAQTITTTAGGHTVPNDMMREIEVALLAYGGVREAGAEVYRTASGATMPIPTVNDTTNKSVVLAINTAADVEALVFGQATMSAYKYTTNMILVPVELFQDTAVDLVGLIGQSLGIRAARGTNNHFTVGVTSDTQPSGVVTDSIVGSTGSDVNTVTYAQLVTLMHGIDPLLRMDASCGWMMNDTTLSVIKKLLDGQNRPLWLPGLSGISGDFPDTLLGKRITINQDMASIASATTGAGAAKAILFGAFNRYKIRDVMDFSIQRLNERYAEKAQVAFLAFHRHDGKTVIATTVTPPIKHFITKST